jgi:hypothetical protein
MKYKQIITILSFFFGARGKTKRKKRMKLTIYGTKSHLHLQEGASLFQQVGWLWW